LDASRGTGEQARQLSAQSVRRQGLAIAENPPRLTLVLDRSLRVDGATPELEAALSAAGFAVSRENQDRVHISINSEPADLRSNESVIRIFRFLIAQGVAFARDYKQTYDPAYSAEYLREVGLVEGPILTCGFDGKSWHVEPAA
jgi:hypothetical protein